MAHSDKNIVITPSIGSTTADPRIVFSAASESLGPQNITMKAYPTNNGTLSIEGSAGQLFSVTNSMTGTIFSVNDVSGIPSIEVLDTGDIKLAQYGGEVYFRGTKIINSTATWVGNVAAVPTASVIMYKGTTAPSGFLLCDGSIISSEQYPDLTPFLSTVNAVSGGTMVPRTSITPTASSSIDTRTADKANDGITNETAGGWHSNYENMPWLQFYFNDVARTVNAYRLYARTDGFAFGNDGFVLYGSNDGSNFTVIDTRPIGSNALNGEFVSYGVTSPGSYRYYRIQSNAFYYQTIAEWQLFVGATVTTQYKLPALSYNTGDLYPPPPGYVYIIKT
jgi:hypothetical protein